jgi:hypothetical protein
MARGTLDDATRACPDDRRVRPRRRLLRRELDAIQRGLVEMLRQMWRSHARLATSLSTRRWPDLDGDGVGARLRVGDL